MHFYESRKSLALKSELEEALSQLQFRFLYAGNVLTFLNDKRADTFETFFANSSRDVRILLMYPYSLFGRDRMAAEGLRVPSKSSASKIYEPLPEFNYGATYSTLQAHWIPDQLSTTLKRLLATFNFPAANIRLTVLNPLCSVLVCDRKAFLTPYHYGRESEEAECTAQNSPVIVLEQQDPPLKAILDHINYLWNQPTTLTLEQCIDSLDDPVRLVIKRPKQIRFPRNIRRTGETWFDLNLIAEQVVGVYCPDESFKPRRAIFFSHPSEIIQEVREMKRLIVNEFYAEGYALLDEDHTGEVVFNTLEERIRQCSHAIVFASKDRGGGSDYPKPNVLHELGWCQALLGAKHVLVLRFPDTKLPSNIGGVIYSNYEGKVSDLEYLRNWLKEQGFQVRA